MLHLLKRKEISLLIQKAPSISRTEHPLRLESITEKKANLAPPSSHRIAYGISDIGMPETSLSGKKLSTRKSPILAPYPMKNTCFSSRAAERVKQEQDKGLS